MALGMEVGLGPGHIVLDGDPAILPKKGQSPLSFRPCDDDWLISFTVQNGVIFHATQPQKLLLHVRKTSWFSNYCSLAGLDESVELYICTIRYDIMLYLDALK